MLKSRNILFFVFVLFIFIFFYEQENLRNFHQGADNIQQNKEAQLIRVVDGDTLLVSINGNKERVRLIGINAPESVKPDSRVECFGREASQHLKNLIGDSDTVFIEGDTTQHTYDKYGRRLAYVFARDINLAEKMIEDGYAYEYTYHHTPYRYRTSFKNAEKKARALHRGLWDENTCNGGL